MKTIMCIVVLAAVASSLPAGTFVPNEEELLEVANNLPSDEEASHEEDPKADALMRAREAKDPEFDFLQNMMAHADEAKTPEGELVQGFNKEFFKGDDIRSKLSNLVSRIHRTSGNGGEMKDFAESTTALPSSASLVNYANAKRLAAGKSATRFLEGVRKKKEAEEDISDPAFRNGPRNNEMAAEVKGIESDEAKGKANTLMGKLYNHHLNDIKSAAGGLGNFFRL